MTELTNTRQALERFAAAQQEKIEAFYQSAACTTLQELNALIEKEDAFLQPLGQDITFGARKACYEGLKLDGVAYSEVAWAMHVGARYSACRFPSLRSAIVREKIYVDQYAPRVPVHTSGGDQKKVLLGGGLVLAGVVCVAAGCIVSPTSGALIVLGLGMTTGGALVIVRQGGAATPVRAAASQPVSRVNEREMAANILKSQKESCVQALKAFCDAAYAYACEAAEKAGAKA